MFLVVVEQDQHIDLKGLRDQLQLTSGQLSFASTERLTKFLGVVPNTHTTRRRCDDLVTLLGSWNHEVIRVGFG